MAASAVKAMKAVPVKEKQVLLETSRRQSKKKLVASQLQKGSVGHVRQGRCLDVGHRNRKEASPFEKTDGAMEGCVGRLALQASSSGGGMEKFFKVEGAVEIGDYAYEELQSKFCLRRYAELVREGRGDLKRSWPLAEKYLQGHIFHVWPPIGGPVGVSAVSQAYDRSSYPPDVPLPHLLKLELAFAESGVSEDREPSCIEAKDIVAEEWPGPHVACSSDFGEQRTFNGGKKMTKRSKFGRKVLTRGADYVGTSRARGKLKKQDRLLGDIEGTSKYVKHLTVAHKTCSEAVEKELYRGVEPSAKHARREDIPVQANDFQTSSTDPGVEIETSKGKLSDLNQEKRMVDKTLNADSLVENAEDISGRAVGIGNGKGAALSPVSEVEERPSSIHMLSAQEHANSNSRQGVREGEVTEGLAGEKAEKEAISAVKRRNENDRVLEERSLSKSDTPSISCFSAKMQSNKACPVCRSFSSMSQTTMNVHIDSCLIEHQKAEEHDEAKTDPVESQSEPSHEQPPPPPPCNKLPKLLKGSGAKPKRKKRSIADIVANSVTRILEEESSPGKRKDVGLSGLSCSATDDQVQDSKNLNWVSGNKKKRQPRNLSSRNLKENESKRRRISCVESAVEAAKPAKQEKRRLSGKEREGTTKKPKQLRASEPSTNVPESSKIQDGEVQCSRGRKTGVAAAAGSSRSGPGKGHTSHTGMEINQREISGSVGLSQSMDLDETHSQSLEITSGRKSLAPTEGNSVPSAAKPRLGMGNMYSGTEERLDSPLLSADGAPKATVLHNRTVPTVRTEAAARAPTLKITCGSTKNPALLLTAENLTGTLPTVVKSSSQRKSPGAANSVQRQKGSLSSGQGSVFRKHSTDEVKASRNTVDRGAGAHVEFLSMAQCKMSKEVDSDLDHSETVVADEAKLIRQSSNLPGGSQALSVELPWETGVTEPITDLLPEAVVAKDVLGKSERILHTEKRPAANKSRVSEDRMGSVVAEDEGLTAVSSEEFATKVGHDLPSSSTQDGCSTVASGDTNFVSVRERSASTLVISRMRKRGRLKAKSRIVAQKTKWKGKGVMAKNAGQVEESSAKGSLSSSDVIQETSVENSQYSEDILKQEHQKEERSRKSLDTILGPTLESSSGVIQPAAQEMTVRKKDVLMGQEQLTEQISLKPIGGDQKFSLFTSDLNHSESPSVEHGGNKGGESSSSQAQANLTHTGRLQGGDEIIDLPTSIFQHPSSILRQATVGPLIKKGVGQAEEHVETDRPKVMVNVVQSQSPNSWSVVPQRPLGRKKLPIKCATRNIISADAVASATSSLNELRNQGSLGSLGMEDPEKCSNGCDVLAREELRENAETLTLKDVLRRSRAARQLAKSVTGSKRGAVHGEVLFSEGQTSITEDVVAEVSASLNPDNILGQSRAARQLAKSVPGCGKSAVRGEILSSDGQTSNTDNALSEPNTENSSNAGSTPAACSLQALLFQTSSSPEDLSRNSTLPERVETGTSTSKNGSSELIDDGAILRSEVVAKDGVSASSIEKYVCELVRHAASQLHCTETVFSSTQSNPKFTTHVPTSNVATAVELKDKGSSSLEVPNSAENETFQEKLSEKPVGSGSRLPVSQQVENGFPSRRSPDRIGIGQAPQVSVVQSLNDEEFRGSNRRSDPEPSFSQIFGPTYDSQGPSRSLWSLGKVGEATGQSRPDTQGAPQAFDSPLATLTSGPGDTSVRLDAAAPKVASTLAVLAPDNQNIYDLAERSTRVSSYGLKCPSTHLLHFQPSELRPGMTSTASLPATLTTLLQSTALPLESSAALSLAMQGTRPLQEASADRMELSRAEGGGSTRAVLRTSIDELIWGLEKHAPPSSNRPFSSHVRETPAFLKPRSETGGSCKGSDAGDKEVSRLPGWMRAAISDPEGSDRGSFMVTEAEDNVTEEVKGLAGSSECEEMSGHVRVRLWGRDVVVPPNEKSTKRNPPTQQEAHGHRIVGPFEAVKGCETVASCGASTACLNGVTLQSQACLKINLGAGTPRVGQNAAESTRQINVSVINSSTSETGVTVSTGAVPAFGKTYSHQVENYFSRVGSNCQRTSSSMKNKAEIRKRKASKGRNSAPPPEVIIIDDSMDSPAESGDSLSGGGLTMEILLDCGALRYLPVGQKGSPLMEVDPSKIPRRLISQDSNVLAELRKIGLIPAPKAALPTSYRRSHSLSVEGPRSTQQCTSKAGTEVLPPWLLAEKKRKEAQNAEHIIILDDDEEGPTEPVSTGERRPLNGVVSKFSSSSISQLSLPACRVSSSTMAKLGRDSLNAGRTSGIPTSAHESAHTLHAVVSKLRKASPSPHGKESQVGKSHLSRRNGDNVGEVSRGVYKEHVNSNTALDAVVMEENGLQPSAARKEQHGGMWAAPTPSPPLSVRDRAFFPRRTDKEVQGSDLQNEKRTPKVGTGVNRQDPPGGAVCSQNGSVSKKGNVPGFSILDTAWNGWPVTGAAAQACKQAVEKLKAEILSSPQGGGNSLAGARVFLDLDSHLIGQVQEKSDSSTKAGNQAHEMSASEQLSSLLERLSSSATLRSRTVVGPKTVSEASTAGLATGAIPSDQRSLMPKQPCTFSTLPPSRLSVPLHRASVSTSSTSAILGHSRQTVCLTDKAANERLNRDICGSQATMEQVTGRMISSIERIQGSDEAGLNLAGTGTTGSTTSDLTLSSAVERIRWSDGVRLNLSGTGMAESTTTDLPLSSLSRKSSQIPNSSNPSSSQTDHISSQTAINPCDGVWTVLGETDAGNQATGPVSSSRSREAGERKKWQRSVGKAPSFLPRSLPEKIRSKSLNCLRGSRGRGDVITKRVTKSSRLSYMHYRVPSSTTGWD
ncbi:hypothetical protein R1flu_016094 [Riccia fluitans]|uniref:Uncharacterized protein n=1 Tax=Riccia fluitans TaxID=41844 RepID=A0ABD1YL13_9MARC